MLDQLDSSDWCALVELRDHLLSLPPSEPEALAEELLAGVAQVVGAEHAYLVVAHRNDDTLLALEADPLKGWRPTFYTMRGPHGHVSKAAADEWVASGRLLEDPLVQEAVAEAGSGTRVLGPVLLEEHPDSPTTELYRRIGLGSKIRGACTLGPRTEVWLGASRRADDEALGTFEAQLLEAALRELSVVLRRCALLCGALGAAKPLTPREQEVLAGLVGGQSARQIADRLELKETSVRQVANVIYRKFDVGSRAELALFWLQGEPPGRELATE